MKRLDSSGIQQYIHVCYMYMCINIYLLCVILQVSKLYSTFQHYTIQYYTNYIHILLTSLTFCPPDSLFIVLCVPYSLSRLNSLRCPIYE